MARPIVLGNGELHVGINEYGLVHDFYFPFVGFENHSAGKHLRHKVGVWADGRISWLDESGWDIQLDIATQALVGNSTARNEELGILLEMTDFVDVDMSALIRKFHIVNLRETKRDIRIFMHQAFVIGDTRSNTDTAQYLPDSDAVLHYRVRRAFVISGATGDGGTFDQHSIGIFGIEGREGTFRDAEDGELSGGNVEHGRVDSILRFCYEIDGNGAADMSYWVAAGTSTREALFVHRQIHEFGVDGRLAAALKWWEKWLQPTLTVAKKLPPVRAKRFIQSAMILKSHIDKHGAVIASTDSAMLNYWRDAYAYCWPRDGAYVLWPLIRLGYETEPLRFFEFCRRALHPSGYLMHKYLADGSIGPSWHPYVQGDAYAPPIQEDETALVLFMFAQYYHMHRDKKVLHDLYDSMVKRMAQFLADYTDPATGLPKPSYDLWEENFMTTTYSTSVVYAALMASAELADEMEDATSAVSWRAAAEDIEAAAHKHLYNSERKAFYKGVHMVDGTLQKDATIDVSSFFGAYMYGLFPIDGQEVKNTYATLSEVFQLDATRLGVPRYEHDNYCRVSEGILGNWWYVTSLWLAQYATEIGDLERAEAIVAWAEKVAGDRVIMSEQINPFDETQLSVAPLAWSHAEYMATVLDMSTEVDSHAP
ncbi:glycoside hydrolase family 15 protein [Candidatus Saccharibacteria bacterium]|nr:glycoside hydrolase family 15 protein [Candidatus Saccharibacteria bacterium]